MRLHGRYMILCFVAITLLGTACSSDNNRATAKSFDRAKTIAILDTVHFHDQVIRRQVDSIGRQYGMSGYQMGNMLEVMRENDSVNIIKVSKILDEYGWLGPDSIGEQGSETIYLVVQHADLKIQEKYLPMMQNAVRNKKAAAADLAMLEDRVALKHGKKQVYGTQIGWDKMGNYYVENLEDPDNVDKRRAEVGLNPMAENVERWGIKWDPAAYKKELLENEEKRKMQSTP